MGFKHNTYPKICSLNSNGLTWRTIFLAAIAAAALSLLPVRPVPAAEYRRVTGPCHLAFPEDHGAHDNFRTEWWYYTGNVKSRDGNAYGFQLTFFRTALRPPGAGEQGSGSAWRTRQLFIGHAAVTDVAAGRHLKAETAARQALDLAGVRRQDKTVSVFVRKWEAKIAPGRHRLRADTENFGFDLSLIPEKPPVLHGEGGYSRKGSAREQASCYYSFTRLSAEGRIRIGDRTADVRGTAWMDHEFSTAPLEKGIAGWDWFSLQLSDGTELMVFFLRQAGGGFHPASAGTFVGPGAKTIRLAGGQLSVEVLDRWKSPDSGADYPIRWRLSVSGPDLDLAVRAAVRDQEMDTRKTTGLVYWEGSVTVEGTHAGKPVSGVGYVEMTGYDRPFDAPM